jgi:hypothetical protein
VGANATHCADSLGVLTCDPFDAETAIGHLERLLDRESTQGQDLYRSVVDRQRRSLAPLGEHESRQRFWTSLERALSDA